MNKGISFYWGYKEIDPEERAKLMSNLGYDCVITNADKKFNSQNGSIKYQVELFKKYNLKHSSLHMKYNSEDLPFFWERGFRGYKLYKSLLNDVKIAKKYGFTCVVVHLKGKPSKVGLNRIKKVLKLCNRLQVPLAIENLSKQYCFEYVFENIDDKYLKFCYDIGHNNCFDPEYDYLSKYGDKLICLHLHDNKGEKDDHTLNKYGTIDWAKFANKLKEINYSGNLDYEVLMCYKEGDKAEDVAKIVLEQARQLEKMINS